MGILRRHLHTHLHIFELRTQNLNLSLKKKSSNFLGSDSWKSAFKIVSEDSQKNIGLSIQPTNQLVEATFQ